MTLKQAFSDKVTGLISYEEVYQRCLDFIDEHKIKSASFEILYLAEKTVAYGAWLRWESGFFIKKVNFCSSLYGVTPGEGQDNKWGHHVDIESKTTYKCSRPWFGPGRVDIRTEMPKAIGSKTQDGSVVKATRAVDESGEEVIILHT